MWDLYACSFQSLTSHWTKVTHTGGNSHTSRLHHLYLLAAVQDAGSNGRKCVFHPSPGMAGETKRPSM